MNTNMHRVLSVAASAALVAGVTACGDDSGSSETAAPKATASGGGKLSGKLVGAGSSAQDAAQQAWTAGFQQANEEVTVSYDPVGSGGGREQFIAGGTAFGGTDDALADDELKGAQKRCGGAAKLVEIPVYVSPIAVIFNVDGADKLELSSATIAGIFHGDITQWDDPAIKKENPDAKLPGDRITVVHRSDESGTTENFTDYLSKTAGDVWTDEPSGDWPVKGQEAASGTSGVVDAVQNGQNTIGYADASQAADLGKADVLVGDKATAPTPEAAAKILDESEKAAGSGANVLTYDLKRDTTSEGVYPVVLTSYEMACTTYKDAKTGALVKGYLTYMVSPEGQKAAAQNAGSAPLTDALTQKVSAIVEKIGG